MKLHVIVVAYNRAIPLRTLIDCFMIQTCPDWDMTIIHDGPAPDDVKQVIALYAKEDRVTFIETEFREENWGNNNRRQMLQILDGGPEDFVLITNDDNYYVPKFIQMMFSVIKPNTGIVFCNFLHHTLEYRNMISELKLNYIDMGAFIVRLHLAQQVGFAHNDSGADGMFAEECHAMAQRTGLQAIHINITLFVHN